MKGIRSTVRGWVIAAAAAAAACGPIDDPGIASDVERELERGRSYATALTARGTAPTTEEAIATGYLERLRLGLGSPFRLIEYSLQDPRMERESRERLAWALLERTLQGESYRIDPLAMGERNRELAAAHLALIEGVIAGSADSDAGMLAVRMAYGMAAAESSVSTSFRDRATQVAALIRDRVLSQKDAERLLRAAGAETDPLALLTVWRVERTFDVERATALAPPAAVERDAIARAPRVLESIRRIRERQWPEPAPARTPAVDRPVLGPEAALLLARASADYDAPPQTPVALAVRSYGRLVTDPDPMIGRFFENAVNEERLAAEYALLSHGGELGVPLRMALSSAAIGLRAYGQERPWFPGFGGPVTRDLEDRFGLASVVFPDDVPAHWRPYYRRMLEVSLTDLRRVLPSLDLRGLNIRFEPRKGSPGTLAVHDPRTRTIYIPAPTGAGTIAHEIAHDIDWQTALRRYRVRGDYGSDRAVRLADDQIGRALRGLTTASLSDRMVPEHSSHATRPAEIFARSVDWFVTVALARDGRMNGYLSSVQDDVLTGYGTVTAPDITGGAGQALVALLDEVAPVYPETRRWFLGRYGRSRAPTAYDLARRLMETPLEEAGSTPGAGPSQPSLALARMDHLEAVRDSVLAMVDGGCRAVAYDNGATAARHRLVRLVTEARARGIALDAAMTVGGPVARDWLGARLQGRERDPAPDETVVAMLVGLVERVESVGGGRYGTRALESEVPVADCGPALFAVD